ncbi:hypothetical protein EDB80DRAFT_93872 [Ilyonectria destructans]|nr:hypothetical protein EDB80DRAFT_93872 [Ilyonectria destructans]
MRDDEEPFTQPGAVGAVSLLEESVSILPSSHPRIPSRSIPIPIPIPNRHTPSAAHSHSHAHPRLSRAPPPPPSQSYPHWHARPLASLDHLSVRNRPGRLSSCTTVQSTLAWSLLAHPAPVALQANPPPGAWGSCSSSSPPPRSSLGFPPGQVPNQGPLCSSIPVDLLISLLSRRFRYFLRPRSLLSTSLRPACSVDLHYFSPPTTIYTKRPAVCVRLRPPQGSLLNSSSPLGLEQRTHLVFKLGRGQERQITP